MSRQPVRVQIFNQPYTLLADGDPREVEEIAQQVDELMTSIASHSGTGDSARVAVLACLHLADKLRSFETQSARITNLLEDTLARL